MAKCLLALNSLNFRFSHRVNESDLVGDRFPTAFYATEPFHKGRGWWSRAVFPKRIARSGSALIAVDSLEVVRRLKQRDTIALGEIYAQYAGLLYSVILRSVADRGTAEDLLQEVFLRIWDRVRTFDAERGSFEAWIVTVARNRAVDHLRGSRRKLNELSISSYVLDKAVGWFACRTIDHEHILRRMAMRAALRSLHASQREVLELAYVQGFTQTEIATRLGKPLGTVKSLVRAALKVLRQSSIG